MTLADYRTAWKLHRDRLGEHLGDVSVADDGARQLGQDPADDRIGQESIPNSVTTWTSVPRVTSPVDRSQDPIASSAMTASCGSSSSAESNPARSRRGRLTQASRKAIRIDLTGGQLGRSRWSRC
jgi:hypothetical protein